MLGVWALKDVSILCSILFCFRSTLSERSAVSSLGSHLFQGKFWTLQILTLASPPALATLPPSIQATPFTPSL